MLYLIITTIFMIATCKRSGKSSAAASTYIEYDSDWYYDPGPSTYTSYSYTDSSKTYYDSSYSYYDSGYKNDYSYQSNSGGGGQGNKEFEEFIGKLIFYAGLPFIAICKVLEWCQQY